MKNLQTGQAILALILIMTVALAIGVSIIQKSLVDVSNSTKVEESQRALSAAEAGIEKALNNSSTTGGVALENQSAAAVDDKPNIPAIPANASQQDGLEYPPISKEEFAHFWLADPNSTLPACNSGKVCYNQASLDVYWGDPSLSSDKAAVEVKIIYYDGAKYVSLPYYIDSDATRSNGFTSTTNPSPNIALTCPPTTPPTTVFGTGRLFTCRARISSLPVTLPNMLMLVRMRLLYNSTSQPVAVQSTAANCSSSNLGACLPTQARIVKSTGSAGQAQRIVQVFQINNVVPPYFDFAIFSAGPINK